MAKRFTETELWKTQRWFRKLKPNHKLAFCYIKDMCNHSGMWKISCLDLIDDLCLDNFDIKDFIDCVNADFDSVTGEKIVKNRLLIVKNNYLWITGFIQFQYEGKDKKVSLSAPVRTALLFLKHIDLLDESISKGYITLKEELSEGWQAPKDKDRDKDRDKVIGYNNKYGKNFSKNEKPPSIWIDGREHLPSKHKDGWTYNTIIGVEVNRNDFTVLLADGSTQPLGVNQKSQFEGGDLDLQFVKKGLIH